MRTATDLDVLAFRFARAGQEVIRGHHPGQLGARAFEPDPALGCPPDRPDMIVGEVKEGPARFNAMVAFGAAPVTDEDERWTTVPMGHVVQFLRSYVRQHWDVLRHAQLRDSPLCVLALLEK